MTPWEHLKSVASIGLITTNIAFWVALAIPVRLVRSVVPSARPSLRRLLDALYRAAVRVDDLWLERVIGIRWSRPELVLDRGRSQILLSNHVSWVDIFLLQSLMARHGFAVQFLTKRELVWLPVVGLVFWVFEFPLLRRTTRPGADDALRRGQDRAAVEAACRHARHQPVALVDFAEGTRATAARRASRSSPHRHLLPPRVGGFEALLDGLGEGLGGVVDCTLVYPRDREIRFWEFLAGRVSEIEVAAEAIAPAEIPATRAERARWLEERWARKDERIAASRGRRD
jgi:1-acyl-sn-glycerol-3-phosphate acyltransferase